MIGSNILAFPSPFQTRLSVARRKISTNISALIYDFILVDGFDILLMSEELTWHVWAEKAVFLGFGVVTGKIVADF